MVFRLCVSPMALGLSFRLVFFHGSLPQCCELVFYFRVLRVLPMVLSLSRFAKVFYRNLLRSFAFYQNCRLFLALFSAFSPSYFGLFTGNFALVFYRNLFRLPGFFAHLPRWGFLRMYFSTVCCLCILLWFTAFVVYRLCILLRFFPPWVSVWFLYGFFAFIFSAVSYLCISQFSSPLHYAQAPNKGCNPKYKKELSPPRPAPPRLYALHSNTVLWTRWKVLPSFMLITFCYSSYSRFEPCDCSSRRSYRRD